MTVSPLCIISVLTEAYTIFGTQFLTFGKLRYVSLDDTSFPLTCSLALGYKTTALRFKVEVLLCNLAFVEKCCNAHLGARVLNSGVVVSVHILRFPLRRIFILKSSLAENFAGK